MTPKVNWHPSNRDIRNFGWTLLVGFGLIGALVSWKGNRLTAQWMWAISTGILVISLVVPILARPFYWIWMSIAVVLGFVMSKVVMAIIFYVVLTPVALIFKLMRRDALKRKKPSAGKQSYWEDHPKISDPHYYDHLF